MSVWDTRNPEHVAVRRSVNGGLVHVCFSVTPGMAVSMRENLDLRLYCISKESKA